jgi:recombinational DNA repair ATPase RecF
MPQQTLAARVENQERRLELLEALPERMGAVELQIVQLRAEMREQFSAIRQELRAEIRAEGDAVRTELRKEIRDGDEETRRYMRVLHEEVLSRMANIQEGLPRRRKR